MKEKIIIASKNPVKMDTAKIGFKKMFPDNNFEFKSISVPSYVPDQPIGDRETKLGALNRANNAKEAIPDANY